MLLGLLDVMPRRPIIHLPTRLNPLFITSLVYIPTQPTSHSAPSASLFCPTPTPSSITI